MKILTNKAFISASVVLNIALVIAIFILVNQFNASKKELIRIEQLNKDSLQYFNKLSSANYFLLQEKNEVAEKLYSLLDSTGSYSHNWHPMFTKYLQNQHIIRDTSNLLKSQLYRLNNTVANLKPVTRLLKEDVDQKNLMIDSLKYDKWGKEIAIKLLSEKNQSLQNKVAELEKAYQRFTFETADGKNIRYFGETVNGKANGFGIGIYASKGLYEGYWQNNMRHGKGKYIWANGDSYEGEFDNDLRNGFGIYLFATGEKYEGHWKNDVREGSGTFYSKEGKVLLSGNWKNDKFIKSEADTANSGT